MTLQIRVRPEAGQDLEDAAIWYEKQRRGLGSEFLDEVRWTFEHICEQPALYPLLYRGARRALMRRFPFCVYYRQADDGIVVMAVMHGSRSPRRWKQRL